MKRTTDPAQPEPLLLSARELARLLSVSTSTVWRLEAAGKLPKPLKLNGSTRWRYSEVSEWIEAGCPPRADSKEKRLEPSNGRR